MAELVQRAPLRRGVAFSLLLCLAVAVFTTVTLWALAAPEVAFGWGRSMVSDLGAQTCSQTSVRWICSPRHRIFNAGQLITGLMLLGAVGAGRPTIEGAICATLLSAGGGLVLLGMFPSDVAYPAHLAGAVLALPVASALLLVGGIRARPVVPRPVRCARVVLGAVGLGVCAVHLAPGDVLRGPAEVVSVGAVCAAILVEAAHGRRLRGLSRPQVGEHRPERHPAPGGSVADPPR